jgi:hypothetical protein
MIIPAQRLVSLAQPILYRMMDVEGRCMAAYFASSLD